MRTDNTSFDFGENRTAISDNYQDYFVGGIGDTISEIRGTIKDVSGLFQEKVTPEAQKAKASTWFQMVEEMLRNPNMTGAQLGAKYESRLPYKQRSTKRRFVANHLNGKPREYVISHLLDKVNDERRKGNLPEWSKQDVLVNLGLDKKEVAKVMTAKPSDRIRALRPKSTITKATIPKPPAKLPIKGAQIDPAYNRVIPLSGTMKMALRTRGINPSPNIEILTNQFYTEIVRKDQPNNYTGQETLEDINVYDYSTDYADAATDAMITAVIQYVRNLKDIKASGQELSRMQEIVVTGTERAEKKIIQAGKDQAAQKVGTEILFGGQWAWIIGGVLAFIVVIIIATR